MRDIEKTQTKRRNELSRSVLFPLAYIKNQVLLLQKHKPQHNSNMYNSKFYSKVYYTTRGRNERRRIHFRVSVSNHAF